MAAYGGHNDALGCQVFVVLRRGRSQPPASCDVRVTYEQTIGLVRAKAAAALGVPADKLQLFHHKRELVAGVHDAKTLLELSLHTGSALKAYDLSDGQPEYWPAVRQTEEGLVEVDS